MTSSLKIKLPATSRDSTPSLSALQRRRKKHVLDSDEEEAGNETRNPYPQTERTNSTSPNYSDVDIDVDVEGNSNVQASFSQELDPPRYSASGRVRRASRPTEKAMALAQMTAGKRRRQRAIYSDDDDEGQDVDMDMEEPKKKRQHTKRKEDSDFESDENDVSWDEDEREAVASGEDDSENGHRQESKKGLKRRGSTKGKAADRGQGIDGNRKRMSKTDEVSRDHDRPFGQKDATRRTRPSSPLGDDNDGSLSGGESQALPTAATSRAPSPLLKDKPLDQPKPPKKQKLPTIRKNKTSHAAGDSSSKAAAPAPAETLAAIAPAAVSRKREDAPKDIDLRDPNVYADILKQASFRPGNNRREKDERRKELNDMRDRYKAKMEASTKATFDLQDQRERIERFEVRLRVTHNPVLYPNVFAAKMRQEYTDNQRRLEKLDEPREADTEPEEGELPMSTPQAVISSLPRY